MARCILFLGSNPALSAIEAISAFHTLGIRYQNLSIHANLLSFETDDTLPAHVLKHLGGTDRIAEIRGTFDHLPSAEELLSLFPLPLPSKWTLGISTHGVHINCKALGVDLKKLLKIRGSRVTFIIPSGTRSRLNAAQVLFNRLTRKENMEFTIINQDSTYIVARTVEIQDIAAYEKRDTSRPARDPKVGMLPPKLAQIMINIATSGNPHACILDPFCGAGTILQEGWLMGYSGMGTDASQAMITASRKNLDWVQRNFNPNPTLAPRIATHDVTRPFPREWYSTVDAVATEPFLGYPLSAPLPERLFDARASELSQLYVRAFQTIHPLLKSQASVVWMLPATQVLGSSGVYTKLLPDRLIDEILGVGYRMKQLLPHELRGSFSRDITRRGTILYGRPGALVQREFTLWEAI